ncbi:MAG: ABC transporter ATP-binding protein [Clostridiaceae bacterium]|nr:ABC transporter ATP-binding protein [Clostridiaceae bacterium]
MALFFATIWVVSQLAIPRLMRDIVDVGILSGNMQLVISRSLLMILAAVINVGSLFAEIYFLTKITAGVQRDLRGDLFDHVIDWSASARQQFSTSSLVTRTVNDVKQIGNFIDLSLRKIYTLILTIVGSVIMSFVLDWRLALIILVVVPIGLILTQFLTNRSTKHYAGIREATDRLVRVFRENISGIKVVKAFNKTKYEEKRFEQATDDVYEESVAAERNMQLLSPAVQLIINFLIIILLYLSGIRAENATIQVGVLIALIEYVTLALTNIQSLAMIVTIIPRSKIAFNRIEEVLKTDDPIKYLSQTETVITKSDQSLPQTQLGRLEFDQVNFAYPGSRHCALEDISLTINPAEHVAIIGSTGSGKSTLLRLITRDYDANQGEVKLANQNVKDLTKQQLNELITIVPQSTFLFSGTVRENIKVGRNDATDEEIWQVLDACEIGDFFRAQETGLDTQIAQSAVNLSGGQKQRVAIARGLIRNTPIYIFDDCFSALDFSTERKIRLALRERLADKTVIIVAQRVATVMDLDEIFVLEIGQLEDHGPHKDLLGRSKVYQEIMLSQLEVEEGVG